MSARRLSLAAALALASFACRRDMMDQPRYEPLQPTGFFEDGREVRPPIAGTVSRSSRRGDDFREEPASAERADSLPMPLTRAFLDRGRERYDVFCSPCHDRTGEGLGMVVRRGYKQPPSYHVDRLREAPIGHFYTVMTIGFGVMPSYASQISPDDRWAIAAYVRALQRSQRTSIDDVPPDERERLEAMTRGGGR